ncbi:hypothetical protein FBY03_1113 [Pseudomonas sp. SJZ079]|nr:hypothetical protein FBY03_1113 [Pseudomonas sp. SJZ079]
MRILVTGGANLIGSALFRHTEHQVFDLDKLTYADYLE